MVTRMALDTAHTSTKAADPAYCNFYRYERQVKHTQCRRTSLGHTYLGKTYPVSQDIGRSHLSR